MKKLLALVLVLGMIFSFAACSGSNPNNITEEKTKETSANNATEEGKHQQSSEEKPVETNDNVTSENNNVHEHLFADADCTTPQKCDCGEVKGEALGHNYKDGKCSRCGEYDQDYLAIPIGKRNALERAKTNIEFFKSQQGVIDSLKLEGFTEEEIQFALTNCSADWNEVALNKVKSMAESTYFEDSKKTVFKTLTEYYYFTEEEAQYAIDNCGIDWKEQALKNAKSYLDFEAISYTKLKNSLIDSYYFTEEEAQYAVDNCGANWNEQALRKAKYYLEDNGYSPLELMSRLNYAEFTTTEAQYAVDHCGADWNEQAAKRAEEVLKFFQYSKQKLIDDLVDFGFTTAQAEYGASKVGF